MLVREYMEENKARKQGDPLWFWNPGQMFNNRGINGRTKKSAKIV